LTAVVVEKSDDGLCRLRFGGPADVREALDRFGEVPLPPYIERDRPPSVEDRERYQTVFAAAPGSVAAPTAGLHFTPELIERVRGLGVEVGFVTLHVGLGTFAPVKADRVEDHVMHEEAFDLPAATWDLVCRAKVETRRVIAVGTTSVRVLETVAAWGGFAESPDAEGGADGGQEPATPGQGTRPTGGRHGVLEGPCVRRTDDGGFRGRTRLFLRPPADFRVVDALLTNFHLPESTLLMLVSAFAAPGKVSGRELVLRAYSEAIRERYRFFSYGDAMLIL
jgi:S-adenosylmethionine:tRNA ribosyltransferase-isomerase